MASTGDPWRTLGLAPGASLDEVRRAYRRLAKANHPDAAGETALPRFLAIQAAYEQIAGTRRARRPGSRPGGTGQPEQPPREPWRADPGRARASGRADGRRPGARPSGRPAEGSAKDRPPDGNGPGAGAGAGPAAGRSRRSSSRRPPKTATPYSTSYDAADEEPFEPGWTGGTWYGASSGTYWTINPKEYADPRKHGPEYQARARRSRDGWILDDAGPGGAADVDGDDPASDAEPEPAPAAGPAPGPTAEAEPSAQAEPATQAHRVPVGRAPGSATRARRRPAGEPRGPAGEPRGRPTAWTAASSARARTAGEPRFGGVPPDGPAVAGADRGRFRGPLLPRPTTPAGRLATALLGWPPLALFVAAAIGESTGCGRYAASCGELSSPGTWIVSIAILLLLLAAPVVAAWSAHGTIAALLIGVPSAVILSAAGGTNLPGASAPILIGVLAIAYLAGIAYALLGPRLAATG